MRTLVALMMLSLFAMAADKPPKRHKDDWQPMFNGTSLDGWRAWDHPESWVVKDGVIHGDGPGSYLFYMKEVCQNCEFKSDVKIGHEGNSGMFFRSPFAKSPSDYEAQVDSSHRDPVRTGSLYHFVKILEVLVPDDTWFNQRIVAEGNHIQVFVNEKQTVDYIDEKNTKTDGLFAIQQHNQGSIVEFKNVMYKELPPPKSHLVGTWRSKETQSEIRILEERDGIRFHSETVVNGKKQAGANFFGREDGYDYVVSGGNGFDHIALEQIDRHKVHEALKVAKIRKKSTDDFLYQVVNRVGFKEVGRGMYTVSADGQTLTYEGKLNDQEINVTYHKADPMELAKAEEAKK